MEIKLKTKKELEKEVERTIENIGDLENYIEDLSTFLPIGVCSLTPMGIVIDVNNIFKELIGFKASEICGEKIENLFLEKKEIRKIIKETKKKGKIGGRELTLISKSKNKIPVNVSFGVRKNGEDNLVGFFVGITDISELKKLQEELEKKVKLRTKDLQEKLQELENFRNLVVGRELKMIELKKEIKKMKEELENYRHNRDKK